MAQYITKKVKYRKVLNWDPLDIFFYNCVWFLLIFADSKTSKIAS